MIKEIEINGNIYTVQYEVKESTVRTTVIITSILDDSNNNLWDFCEDFDLWNDVEEIVLSKHFKHEI